jgi:prophage regulatory protein
MQGDKDGQGRPQEAGVRGWGPNKDDGYGDGFGGYVDKAELRQITNLSDSTIARLEREGRFPRRRKLSTRRVGWRRQEVAAWCGSRQ